MKKLISVPFILLLSACSTIGNQSEPEVQAPQTAESLLDDSYQHLDSGKVTFALATLLKAEKQCNEKHADNSNKIFVARSPDERFFYLLQATFEEVATSVEKSLCADVHYLLGYTYVELKNLDNALKHVTKALEFSPVNAAYLSELGHIYQLQGDFQKALNTYKQAEENADAFSPAPLKQEELGRAKRGIGYSLIELGELEQAKAKFNEALALNPNDNNARAELAYINSL
ncbi:tetratricopeptide repeat protein [Alteromonadaceae bacterium M269]|nr:tetratricopeptide repeat protein [Alteromonadaceae bacterium M269]